MRIGRFEVKKPLCIGTMTWGCARLDTLANVHGVTPFATLLSAVNAARQLGLSFFDTAEGYGGGSSEERIAELLRKTESRCERSQTGDGRGAERVGADDDGADASTALVATKLLPAPWRCSRWMVFRAVRGMARRLGAEKVDILYLHTPTHWLPLEWWVHWCIDAREAGLCDEIALSNCSEAQVRRAHAVAASRGVPICAHQMLFSLTSFGSAALKKCVEACEELGIPIIGFSPLGQGLLCDGLDETRISQIRAARMSRISLDDLNELRAAQRDIADAHAATMGQVAINWCVGHGVIPLVGCRTERHVREAAAALDFSLSGDEISRLDALALDRSTLEKPKWRRALFMGILGLAISTYNLERWLLPARAASAI